jgi:hypothetical protein
MNIAPSTRPPRTRGFKDKTMIVPANTTEVSALIGTAMTLLKRKAS